MANHVSNTIEIWYDKNNESYNEFCKRIENLENNAITVLFDEYNEDEHNTRTWWEDNIGAKWAYAEDSYY